MTLNEITDPEELINLCDIFLFGMLPDNTFAATWAEGEFSHNPSLLNGFKKDSKMLKNKKQLVGRRYKDANGILRVFMVCRVDKDGEYNKDQLTALRMITDSGHINSRLFPLLDTFGFGFDIVNIPSQDGPSDQPGGVFIAGDIPTEVQETIKEVFNTSMVDIFICKQSNIAEQIFGLQDAKDMGDVSSS